VYKRGIPGMVQELEELRAAFSHRRSPTDWSRLRIDPLLAHARALDARLRSKRFQRETSRLRVGVEMFHSELVYLRVNVRALRRILETIRPTSPTGSGSRSPEERRNSESSRERPSARRMGPRVEVRSNRKS
jgi:hypothetical protein